MIKKKILAIIPRMPFPLNSGGRIATYDTLKILSRKYNLVLIILDDDPDNIKYIENVKLITKEIHFIYLNKYICSFNAIKGIFLGRPLQVGYFYSKKIQKLVNELSIDCDLFLAFVIRTTLYAKKLKIKKIHYAVDSMFLNYSKSIVNAKSFLWKLIYKIELPLLHKFEIEQVKNFDLTTFVNKQEADYWSTFGNVVNLPHGIDNSLLLFNEYDDIYNNVVSFIGRMDYQPNIDAIIWFCENVLHNLNTKIEFWVIGGFMTPNLKDYLAKYDNVKVIGYVESPNLIIRSSFCNVAPMQTGGGLQTKILLSMALESIVITTNLSAAPINDAKNLENIIVEDDPIKISEYINDIFLNFTKYEKIKANARHLISKNYTNSKIEEKLMFLIDQKLNH
jgi:glycosyltransferase involved in cell wall biosynthesis